VTSHTRTGASLAWPDSLTVTYVYDAANRLTAIQHLGSSIVTFAYDTAAGARA
jgi:YD repeat-containing protein